MKINELHQLLGSAIDNGFGDADVLFDTDAACYQVHLIPVRGCMEPEGLDRPVFILSTPGYHGTCDARKK